MRYASLHMIDHPHSHHTMCSAGKILSLDLFYCHLILAVACNGYIRWFLQTQDEYPITSVADCHAAINMISGPHARFNIPQQPRYMVPAIFRSGSCSITVDDLGTVLPHLEVPPAIRLPIRREVGLAAGNVLMKCDMAAVHGSNAGHTIIAGQQDSQRFGYYITVSGAPPRLPRDGREMYEGRSSMRTPYNVYTT